MRIDSTRSFAASEMPSKLMERARQWAGAHGWSVVSEDRDRLVARRGGGLWSFFTFDLCKLPTVATVSVTGDGPYDVHVRYEVDAWSHLESPGDRKRVEDQLALIVARLKGAV